MCAVRLRARARGHGAAALAVALVAAFGTSGCRGALPGDECRDDCSSRPTTAIVGGAGSGAAGGGGPTASGGLGGAGGGPTAGDAGPDAGGPCSNDAPTGDFPRPVARVLENCQRCHVPADQHPLAAAPFPLVRYEDVVTAYLGKPVWQRIGPAVGGALMPPRPPALTADEKKTLLDWVEGCAPPAPEGQGCDVGEGCTP